MGGMVKRKFEGVSVRTTDADNIEGRLDRVAAELSKRAAGVKLKRGTVAKAALERGLAAFEAELFKATNGGKA